MEIPKGSLRGILRTQIEVPTKDHWNQPIHMEITIDLTRWGARPSGMERFDDLAGIISLDGTAIPEAKLRRLLKGVLDEALEHALDRLGTLEAQISVAEAERSQVHKRLAEVESTLRQVQDFTVDDLVHYIRQKGADEGE